MLTRRLTFPLLVYLFVSALLDVACARKRRRKFKRGFQLDPQLRSNIIFVMADDLDIVLGSPEVMTKTKRIMREEGVEFMNAFTTSPLCCPSRSSILTGRYAHNHNVQTNNRNCSGPEWHSGPEKETFGRFMQEAGYRTAYFGKYLNNYDGSYIPPGWNEWLGLIGNSKFYNYTLNNNGRFIRHNNVYKKDYFTDVLTDATIDYFTKYSHSRQPLMVVLSLSAPHGPEDSAPQYQKKFPKITAPRYPNYNYTADNKHWIIQQTPPLDENTSRFTDVLYRKRLQTLLSVDDAIEKLYLMLLKTGQIQNTYLVFSSDHGYHLGQFGQVKGKAQPYEADIRIPLYMRGPQIPRGKKIHEIALNIDFAPTFLDIAGSRPPAFMDGSSLMDVAVDNTGTRLMRKLRRQIWKDTFLVERGKLKALKARESRPVERQLRFVFKTPKQGTKFCDKPDTPRPPCTPDKKWVCMNVDNVWYLQSCETMRKSQVDKKCVCPYTGRSGMKMPAEAGKQVEGLPEGTGASEFTEGNDEIQYLLLHLERQFGKLKRRIKRHGVKYLQKLANQNLDATQAQYVEASDTLTDSIVAKVNVTRAKGKLQDRLDRKISKAIQRLQYWQREREKMYHTKVLRDKLKDKFIKKVQDTDKKDKLDEDGMEVPSTASPVQSTEPVFIRTTKTMSAGNSTDPVSVTCYCPLSAMRKKKSKKVRGRDMNCFHHDKYHWKTPPFWDGPGFTACTNSPNSSYWCLRTINQTHNFLYCEFVTGFKEYFDIFKDPFQLKNIAFTIPEYRIKALSTLLASMKHCKGAQDCLIAKGKRIADEKMMLRKLRRYERRKRKTGPTHLG